MKGLTIIAKTLGARAVSLLILIITLALSLLLLQFYQNSQFKQGTGQQTQFQQQVFNTMQGSLHRALQSQQNVLGAISASPEVSALARRGDMSAIESWQKSIAKALPSVQKLCLFLTLPESPDADACLPVSFATLASLRQLKDKPAADVAMMQPGSDKAHMLFAQHVEAGPAYPDAALLVAVDPSWLDEIIDASFVTAGYTEITQGQKSSTVLTSLGDPQFKSSAPTFSQPVADSALTLHYWSIPSASNGFGMMMAVFAALLVLAWLLRDSLFSKLVRNDSEVLQKQLHDLENERLEKDYPLLLKALKPISHQIRELIMPARPVSSTALKTEAVVPAESENEVLMSSDPEQIVEHALVQASKKEVQQPEPVSPETHSVDFAPSLPDMAIFRHYDVRGKVGPQLNAEVMLMLGQAVGSEALDQSQHKLVLGRDGRLTSDELAQAFIKGVTTTGCDVIDLGQVPTPMVYFACEHLETHTGAMITGSHNPVDYNGLKIVIAGKTLLGKQVTDLYQRIKDKNFRQGQGQLSKQNIHQAYIDRIKGEISLSRPVNIVVDCGNGVAGNIAPDLFRALGCEVTELYCEVDGNFPHHHPDPGQPENMQDLIKIVQSQQAELGLAYDGDGDRLGVVDAEGNIIWPDRLLLLMAQYMLVEQPGATIMYDVKSTNMLEEVISRAGGNPVMTPSGHSVIKSLMQEHNAMLAGEMTGHFFFRDRWYGFDDALYSAARLLELLAADPLERTPTEVFAALPSRVSTPEIIVDLPEGESHHFIEKLQESAEFSGASVSTVDGVRVNYPQGWGLVRASNTVPGLTLRFEATSKEELEQIKQQFIQQMLQIKPTLSLLF